MARDLEDGPGDAEERERILDRFAASPHAIDAPSLGWSGLALEYAAEHRDTSFADFDGEVLDEIVFEVFPRKVSCEPDAASEAVCSLRAFWTFARDVLAHPHAEDCLQVLGEGAAERLERALADPSNFGLAKSFVMSGGVPGLSGRSGGSSCRPASSHAQRKQKKRERKQRKQAQRRNRR